ncbi:MAG: MFS transporter [Candidatus Lokiarchaeota archaeon]|nr:MFS transporter [Candidatus Harpocratesius repetitus]
MENINMLKNALLNTFMIKFFPPLEKYTVKQSMGIFASIFVGSTMWLAHFVLEIKAILEANLPLYFAIFPYIGCIFGGIFAFIMCNRVNFDFSYLFLFGCYIGNYILQIWIHNKIFTIISIFLAGLLSGSFYGFLHVQLIPAFSDSYYSGRMNALSYCGVATLIIIDILLTQANLPIWSSIYLASIYFIFFLIYILSRSERIIFKQITLTPKEYINQPKIGFKILLNLLWGFFLTTPAYVIMTYYILWGREAEIFHFILVFFISVGIFSPFNGYLLDHFGRKGVVLTGFGILSFAFLFLPFLNFENTWNCHLLAIILGIGLTMAITTNTLVSMELAKTHTTYRESATSYILMGVGLNLGVIFVEILKPLFSENFFVLPAAMSIIFVIATIVITQLEESLPSLNERKWKSDLLFLYLFTKTGIPIASFGFNDMQAKEYSQQTLMSGALTAISKIIQYLVHNKQPIKVIKQENSLILIEEGIEYSVALVIKKEYEIARILMQKFLTHFEILCQKEKIIASSQNFIQIKNKCVIEELVKNYFR